MVRRLKYCYYRWNGNFAGFPGHPPRPAPIGTGIGTWQSGMGRVQAFFKNPNRVRGGVFFSQFSFLSTLGAWGVHHTLCDGDDVFRLYLWGSGVLSGNCFAELEDATDGPSGMGQHPTPPRLERYGDGIPLTHPASDWISVWGDCILNAFGGLVVVQVDIIQATPIMSGVARRVFVFQRQLNTLSHDGPTDTLKRKIAGMEKIRKRRDPKKDQFYVEVPESQKFLDTATWPMTIAAVGVAVIAKLFMMLSCCLIEFMVSLGSFYHLLLMDGIFMSIFVALTKEVSYLDKMMIIWYACGDDLD
ncbi:hypothetical protein CK203_038769 [Vitis vinifera]|uniref:Uncharacterized protein n=1 Tax=Vitis vinifera TaxID=29760 RepID=A0A438I1T9_VITVI|nr:hypothetical protein CK203_038769 [Vitis vinifera]